MLSIAYHPIYQLPLPEGHRFPMEKYDLLPKQLLHEGTCTQADFFEPTAIDYHSIEQVHSADYLQRLLKLALDKKAKELRKAKKALEQKEKKLKVEQEPWQ